MHQSSDINKVCNKLLEVKRNYEKKAIYLMKKYQSDADILYIYGSYMADFLEQEEGNLFLQRSELLKESKESVIEKLTGFRYQKGASIMVVSGMYETIGNILYLNAEITELLKIENLSDFIGSSFIQFIPAPFDVIHNDVLRRYLIFGEKIELYRPHMFLIATDGSCVEVSMHFRLVFYKQMPYFIADFNPRNQHKNLILHSSEGMIYAASKNIKSLISSRQGTLFDVIPNLDTYFDKYDIGKPFEYNEDFFCSMMRFQLSIDGLALEVLYIADNFDALSPVIEDPEPSFIRKPRKRAGSSNEINDRTDISMEPDMTIVKNIVSTENYTSSILSKVKPQQRVKKTTENISKLCSTLN